MTKTTKTILIVLGSLLLLAILLIGWAIGQYNRVIAMDENISGKWAQVENQLQRRNDLIPNLVSTVKGYMTHEQETFTNITKLRSQWGKAQTTKAQVGVANEMGGAISRLLLVAENYPELKANQNFLSLQAQLEGTENRIAVERMRYNEDVQDFNAHIKKFPANIIAGAGDFSKRSYYEGIGTPDAP